MLPIIFHHIKIKFNSHLKYFKDSKEKMAYKTILNTNRFEIINIKAKKRVKNQI